MPAADARRDELLAIRCQLGDAAALDELIDTLHEPLRRYARRVAGTDADADDVVQDAWLRILRALPRLRTPASLRSWAFGITHRVLMDRFRGQYARVDISAPPPLAGDVAVDEREAADAALWHARLDELEQAIARLPMVERDVLSLFYLDNFSLAEVAGALDVPLGTVKSRLFRARQLLREQLTHDSAR
jgi:RNA polymerase sigma-70 factor (ECF subfamily)